MRWARVGKGFGANGLAERKVVGRRETCPSRVWLSNDPRDRAGVAFSPFARRAAGRALS